jgi:enamine deaminase RidA (YjgF/YER057c/UK114 family)
MGQTNQLAASLARLGLSVVKPSGTFGTYVPARKVGNLIYIAGQLPMKEGKLIASGPVPEEASIEHAQLAARQCVLNALGAVETLDGGIAQLKSVVRVGAFVQCADGFDAQPKVANAASELLIELFGDAGRHVRAAVGTNALPLNASVEIEFLFETF